VINFPNFARTVLSTGRQSRYVNKLSVSIFIWC